MDFTHYEEMRKQKDNEKKWMEASLEVQKAAAKTAAIENVRIQSAYMKQQIRERELERRKSVCDEVRIMSNGEIQIMTKNLSIDVAPRSVTNLKSPGLIILKRAADEEEQIFQINGISGNRDIQVFLEKRNAGNASYLLKKFTSSGIDFYLPLPKAKRMTMGLLCALLEFPQEEKIIPDSEGWMKKKDGTFTYVEKGELTWIQALKLSK